MPGGPSTAFSLGFLALLLGLSAGSFLNVVIHRLPRRDQGLSLFRPGRSFCPACGAAIRWHDNIPVLSWLLLKGACRDCRRPISIRYPLVELASGILALSLFNRYGPGPEFLIQYYFVLCLLAIALIDLEFMLLPVVLVYPAVGLGLLGAWAYPAPELAGPWLWLGLEPALSPPFISLAAAAAGLALGWGGLKAAAAAFKALRGREVLGDGDPPLLGLIGVYLGWRVLPLVILWALLIGLMSALTLMLLNRRDRPAEGWGRKALPFGPFLVLAAYLQIFFGQAFMAGYLSLAG
ncbi:MAG: prepilin peptidase [Candidatus Adiutrix sp.]|jgi:leader peptidase (prepilin peptidase)/N-methyltransferase|nr:prepilin peptidase [Candidatus Adiutrix sp.]